MKAGSKGALVEGSPRLACDGRKFVFLDRFEKYIAL
jgi:hypothetical protein